jgi:protease I
VAATPGPTIQNLGCTDIRNAGGKWVDEEVHVDDELVTSRRPDDLDAEGVHAGQREAATTSG